MSTRLLEIDPTGFATPVVVRQFAARRRAHEACDDLPAPAAAAPLSTALVATLVGAISALAAFAAV